MPRYEIRGKGKDTGRNRRRIYSAANESAARQQALDDGTMIDEITEIPPDPPTDRQLDYARSLGIPIPANATTYDLSDLISIKVDGDKAATERHKNFGRMYGIDFTEYIGKQALFNKIQYALIAPGREKELLSWFTFRVYRELVGGVETAPIKYPSDPIIQEIAEIFVTDDMILKSVRRYEGSQLIWFGEWTSPDGGIHRGGSNRTEAYKAISSTLKQRAALPAKQQNANPSAQQQIASPSAQQRNRANNSASNAKGCLSTIVIGLAIPVVFVLSVAWLGEVFA